MSASPDISVLATRAAATRLSSWLLPGATAAVLGVAYGPLLFTFFAQQWERPHYQYFPFVLGAFAWLLWRNSAQAEPRIEDDSTLRRVGIVGLLLASWLLLAQAYYSDSPLLAIVSAILLVAGGFLQIGAKWRVNYLWGIWALLWLMVRMPLNRDQVLITQLQRLSSKLSSVFLDLTGIEHLMDGNTLVLPDKQFFVDEACSGIVSVLSIIACAVIYGVWRNRPPAHVALLALAGVGWATLMNVLRITVIAIAFARWGVDWSAGTSHEILGLVIFTFIFLALVSTDFLLIAVLAPIRPRKGGSGNKPIRFGAKLVAFWDRLQTWGAPESRGSRVESREPEGRRERGTKGGDRGSEFGVHLRPRSVGQFALGVVPLLAFGTLSGTQLVVPYWFGDTPRLTAHGLEGALALDAGVMPARVGALQMRRFRPEERQRDDIMGQYSRIYEFQDEGGNDYLASCDFPFSTWHDLTVCYKGIGWTQKGDVTVHTSGDAAAQPWDYVEVDFTKPDGSAGHLVYSVFDEYGRPVIAPRHSIFSDMRHALARQRQATRTNRVFQIQVWTTGAGRVSERQCDAARTLLLQARAVLRRSITQSTTPVLVETEPNQNQ